MPKAKKPKQSKVIAAATADFVAMVSHQLKGPLAGIRAASAMLAAEDYGRLPVKAKATADLISHTTSRLLNLIDTYLESTRLDLGSFAVRPRPTDVRQELENLVAVMSTLAKLKGLTLMFDVPKDTGIVRLDGDILASVAFSLVDNAIAYTDSGSIMVSAERLPERLILRVADTGPGMSQAEAKTLFQKFQRGEIGRRRRHKGTGLGLFLVKRLTEACGGSVKAESRGSGMGSIFEASFPI